MILLCGMKDVFINITRIIYINSTFIININSVNITFNFFGKSIMCYIYISLLHCYRSEYI